MEVAKKIKMDSVDGKHRSTHEYLAQPHSITESTPDEFDGICEAYVEPKDDYSDKLEYERTGDDQGIVIIFNQFKFPDENRYGSPKDVKDIKDVLSRLGYNISEKYVYIDYTKEQIMGKLDELKKEDFSDRNSLILFFMTHGDKNNTLYTGCYDELSTKDIWLPLANHKDLRNKPKLFVFQACKGGNFLAKYEERNENEDYKITSISPDSIPPRDAIICFSTAEDKVSFRDEVHGTWLIQEICKNFLAYGRRDDVPTLLTRALKCVSNYEDSDSVQMPVMLSTLSKRFYLCNSKDRRNNNAVYQSYNQIYEVLERLSSKVETLEKLLS